MLITLLELEFILIILSKDDEPKILLGALALENGYSLEVELEVTPNLLGDSDTRYDVIDVAVARGLNALGNSIPA